jgi:hypothetical protein
MKKEKIADSFWYTFLQLVMNLDHPNVIVNYGFSVFRKNQGWVGYFLMEIAPDGSLRDRWQQARLEKKESGSKWVEKVRGGRESREEEEEEERNLRTHFITFFQLGLGSEGCSLVDSNGRRSFISS